MAVIELQIINPTFFFPYLKGRSMETNLVTKMGQNYLPHALIALSFRKVMGHRYLNVRINSVYDASISCENFVKFGPVISELTGLFVNARFCFATTC